MKTRDIVFVTVVVFTFGYGAYSMWRDFRGSSAYQLVAMIPWPTIDPRGALCR